MFLVALIQYYRAHTSKKLKTPPKLAHLSFASNYPFVVEEGHLFTSFSCWRNQKQIKGKHLMICPEACKDTTVDPVSSPWLLRAHGTKVR